MAFQGFGKVQVGADGRCRFRTIKPAPYPGRTPHIHVKVKLGNQRLLTSQMHVAAESANDRDGLFRRLNAADRGLLQASFSKGDDGWRAEFPIVVAEWRRKIARGPSLIFFKLACAAGLPRPAATNVGLRMLLLRHLVQAERGLLRPKADELPMLRYCAHSGP